MTIFTKTEVRTQHFALTPDPGHTESEVLNALLESEAFIERAKGRGRGKLRIVRFDRTVIATGSVYVHAPDGEAYEFVDTRVNFAVYGPDGSIAPELFQ